MRAGPLRVLVLDFDGVILESNDVKTEAFRDVFTRFPEHCAAMMAYHLANLSEPRSVKFDYLLERLGHPGDAVLRGELAADFSRRVLERMASVPLVAGAEAFLREVTPRLPVYLASVTPAEDLDATLERRGLRAWFRDVYGCPPWTKPGAVRDVLRREACAPHDALLLGDSAADQRTAAETGVGFVARDSGLAFDDPAPPTLFPDLAAVATYLRDRLP
jgi:phosphoglycolate phosphatase-like HAD superfamily hydrolase